MKAVKAIPRAVKNMRKNGWFAHHAIVNSIVKKGEIDHLCTAACIVDRTIEELEKRGYVKIK